MKTNKTVMEGETVVLECQARGNPHPKVEWLKDSMPTVLTLRHFSTGESQFLIIVQTNRDDEGHLCFVAAEIKYNYLLYGMVCFITLAVIIIIMQISN